MSIKPHILPDGRQVSLGGRRLPTRKFRGARFSQVVNVATLPTPPEWNWNAANPSLNADGQGNILGNNQYGDCFWAAMAHIIDSERAASGNPGYGTGNPNYGPVTADQTLWAYSAGTGFNVATGAGDNGTELPQGLDFCRDKGFFQDGSGKIVGYAEIDPTNLSEVKTAAWLFGNLIGGLCLPAAYMQNLTRWGMVGPGSPNDGHAIASPEGGYNSKSLLWNSWGYIIPMDWDAVTYYFSAANGGELFVVFTEDGINKASGKAVSGFDAATLTSYLTAFKA